MDLEGQSLTEDASKPLPFTKFAIFFKVDIAHQQTFQRMDHSAAADKTGLHQRRAPNHPFLWQLVRIFARVSQPPLIVAAFSKEMLQTPVRLLLVMRTLCQTYGALQGKVGFAP